MVFRTLTAAAILALGTTAVVAAPHEGFYVGADAGQAKLDGYADHHGARLSPSDDTATAYTILAGYRFSKYFALETGYADLGDFTAVVAAPCPAVLPAPDCTIDVDTRMSGAFVNAIGALPLGEHAYLSATLGAFYHNAETTAVLDSNVAHTKDSGTVAHFGIGLGFPVSERFEITVDWMRLQEIDVSTSSSPSPYTYDAGFSVLTAGARFFF